MQLCCLNCRALADSAAPSSRAPSAIDFIPSVDCVRSLPIPCCSDLLGRPRPGVRVEATGEAEMRLEERPPHASGSSAPVEGRYVDARSGPSRGEANAAVQVREGARTLK